MPNCCHSHQLFKSHLSSPVDPPPTSRPQNRPLLTALPVLQFKSLIQLAVHVTLLHRSVLSYRSVIYAPLTSQILLPLPLPPSILSVSISTYNLARLTPALPGHLSPATESTFIHPCRACPLNNCINVASNGLFPSPVWLTAVGGWLQMAGEMT